MAASTHRNRHIEFWVEKAAQAVARARSAHGEEAVASRIEGAISREDYETTARVLRVVARELGDAPTDLDALDRRLRDLAGVDAAPEAERAEPASPEPGPRPTPPTPPTRLRRDMIPPRRG